MLSDKIPNSLMYIALLTAEEIMGKNGLHSILNYAKINEYRNNYPNNNEELGVPVADFMKLISSTIQVFGESGARSILHNCGKMAFHLVLKENPALFGLVGLSFKFLTKKKRAEKMLDQLNKASNKIFGEVQRFYVGEHGFVTEIYDCFYCKGLKSDQPICSIEVGFEAESLRWVTNDHYEVREVLCRARGDDVCKFVVPFEPKAI